MKRSKSSSADSAARFITLKSSRKVKRPYEEPPRKALRQAIDLRKPPEKWRFVEKHVPGCFFAWVQTVDIRTEGMTFGITGRPSRVVAVDDGCYRSGYIGCRCHVFADGTWQKRNHPVVECCARKVFGDGMHATACAFDIGGRATDSTPTTSIALGPQIEEHW